MEPTTNVVIRPVRPNGILLMVKRMRMKEFWDTHILTAALIGDTFHTCSNTSDIWNTTRFMYAYSLDLIISPHSNREWETSDLRTMQNSGVNVGSVQIHEGMSGSLALVST